MSLVFEWNPRKAQSNHKKHGITFEEAATVFSDPLARIFADEKHSDEEPREIMVGHSSEKGLLLVCFTELEMGRVRIISARRATRLEQQDYEENVST